MRRAGLFSCLLVLILINSLNGQGRFFWTDELGNHHEHLINVQFGVPTEIFLYYQTMGQDISDGFRFDFSFSRPDSVLISSAKTFNFEIVVGDTPIGSRWDSFGDADVDGHVIQNFAGMNSGSQAGLLGSNDGSGPFLDEGYDPTNDAFLMGSMVITVIDFYSDLTLNYDFVEVLDDGQATKAILGELPLFSGNCYLNAPNDLWQHSLEIEFTEFPFLFGNGNNYSFTEPGEQQLESTGSTVWHHMTAQADGIMSINMFAEFDTQLHIFEGGENGFENLLPVANNNDADGRRLSRVSFPIMAGKRYDVRVGSYDDQMGSGKNSDGEEGCFRMNIDFLENALPGDINCDGSVNLLDVAPFVETIVIGSYDPKADVNFDGDVNLLDVNPFVVLIGG